MDKLNENIARILDCLQDINRNIAALGDSRKRPRLAIESDSESEDEAPEAPTCVTEEAPEAEEDGARFCIKTHYDNPVIVVSEKPNGARLYRTLLPAKQDTPSSSGEDVFDVVYSSAEPLLDEEELPDDSQGLSDTEYIDDGTRAGFLNPASNRVFRILPLCGDRDYSDIKTSFMLETPEAPDFVEKKAQVLWGLEHLGAPLAFGSPSNVSASDEMQHMLLIDVQCQQTTRLAAAKEGYLCDACNLRRTITHTWDGGINLGKNCAEKVDFIANALRLVPRSAEDTRTFGEALFARFIAHAETLLALKSSD